MTHEQQRDLADVTLRSIQMQARIVTQLCFLSDRIADLLPDDPRVAGNTSDLEQLAAHAEALSDAVAQSRADLGLDGPVA